MTDDVRERFLEAELNGELGLRWNGVASGKCLSPGPDPGEVFELTGQPQLR